MKKILGFITWGNPILLASFAGASGVRLFDLMMHNYWLSVDGATFAFFVVFALVHAIGMQFALSRKQNDLK